MTKRVSLKKCKYQKFNVCNSRLKVSKVSEIAKSSRAMVSQNSLTRTNKDGRVAIPNQTLDLQNGLSNIKNHVIEVILASA